jgi:hypothetical protein
VDVALGTLSSFLFLLLFHGEQNLDIHDLVKVTRNSIELGRYIVSQSWGDFEVMTADRQVHGYPPVALAVEEAVEEAADVSVGGKGFRNTGEEVASLNSLCSRWDAKAIPIS